MKKLSLVLILCIILMSFVPFTTSAATSEDNPQVNIAVTDIWVSPTTTYITVGDSQWLSVTVLPVSATDKTVTLTSSNTAVATVDNSSRYVTAVGAGTATITVRTNDGGKTATCNVIVTGVAVSGVSVEPTTATMTVGDWKLLVVRVMPITATNQAYTYASSNTAVAVVKAGPTITAVGAGTATITVRTVQGGKTATCDITVVSNNVVSSGITLNKTMATIELGRTEKLLATVLPENALNKNVTWSSSNPNVAGILGDGVVVPLSTGTAVITARTADGGFTASCTVTVVEAKPEHIPGDINGDGKVNIADLIRLAQWLAEINTTPLGEP